MKDSVTLDLKGGQKNAAFSLPEDLACFKVLDKETTRSMGTIFWNLVVFLLIGGVFSLVFPYMFLVSFFIWICWVIGYKETRVTAAIELKTGQKFSATLNNRDWNLLKGFITG